MPAGRAPVAKGRCRRRSNLCRKDRPSTLRSVPKRSDVGCGLQDTKAVVIGKAEYEGLIARMNVGRLVRIGLSSDVLGEHLKKREQLLVVIDVERIDGKQIHGRTPNHRGLMLKRMPITPYSDIQPGQFRG